MNGYIKMTLLSDTCVATGFSISGIVDEEISRDDFGIPFIPAKRIFGIMRQQAMDLSGFTDQSNDRMINRIFGAAGMEEGALLTLRNGYLEAYDNLKHRLNWELEQGDKLSKDILSPWQITNYFCSIRSQTALECGIAKDNSLRTIQAIRRGNIFFFPLRLDNSSDVEKQFVKDVISCVRHIGSSRNRGLGYVQCEWIEDDGLATESTDNIGSSKSLKFCITLEADTVLGGDYIPASAILGICASKYIKQNLSSSAFAHEDQGFRELFLDGELKISNAYPTEDGCSVIPVPDCFKKCKDENDSRLFNLLQIDQTVEERKFVSPKYKYISHSDKNIRYHIPQQKLAFHHRRGSNPAAGSTNTDDGQFFEYDSIVAGTKFIGEMHLDSKSKHNLADIKKLLDNQFASLGKSKKTQYGDCRFTISDAKVTDSDSDYEYDLDDGQISLLLTSDLINLNQYGEPSLSISDLEGLLRGLLEDDFLQIDKEHSYFTRSQYGSFNAKHRMPTAVLSCFGKGSVVTIKSDKCDAIARSVSHLFFGEMTNVGYGRLIVLPKQEDRIFAVYQSKKFCELAKVESPTFDTLFLQLQKQFYLKRGLTKLYTDTLTGLWGNVDKVLNNSVVKSPLFYLYDQCLTIKTIYELHTVITCKMDNGSTSAKAFYNDLYEALGFELLENKQSLKYKRYPSWDSLIEGNLGCIFEEVLDKDEMYIAVIMTLCQKAIFKRRRNENE